MLQLWVNGFSFFHCVASPFHSFVPVLQLCRECNQPGLCHFLRLPIRLPDSVKLFACQIICMPVSPWQLVGVLQPDMLMLNPKIDCSSAKLSCHVAALAVPTLTSVPFAVETCGNMGKEAVTQTAFGTSQLRVAAFPRVVTK